ncbi:hypothetical protein AVEN_38297-1 [Araneus ventricosus]|uniref:Retrovirus-related Pol polyprotein from transposon TNT 1-94 n=1 Tax=Araneus ventricosus TaxID=182803 RepID=A0A4Y2E8K3_ARAVE|nr:hypothetical protein AVEN_38297-1 [Araneus ventricosus]
MNEHIAQMLELIDKLKAVGEEIKDDHIAALLLVSVPKSYDTLITALEARPENEVRLGAYRQFLRQLNSLVGLPALRDFTATKLFSCDGCTYMRLLISFDSSFLDALAVFSRTAHALGAPKLFFL